MGRLRCRSNWRRCRRRSGARPRSRDAAELLQRFSLLCATTLIGFSPASWIICSRFSRPCGLVVCALFHALLASSRSQRHTARPAWPARRRSPHTHLPARRCASLGSHHSLWLRDTEFAARRRRPRRLSTTKAPREIDKDRVPGGEVDYGTTDVVLHAPSYCNVSVRLCEIDSTQAKDDEPHR